MWIDDIGAEGKLFVVHAQVKRTTNREVLNHYLKVFSELLAGLKAKGISEIETWTITEEQKRYAEFFGFEHLGQLTVHGKLTTPVMDRLRIRF